MCSGSRTKRPVTQSLKAMTFTLAPRPMSTTPALFGFVALDLDESDRYFGLGESATDARADAFPYCDDLSALDVIPTTARFLAAAAEYGDVMPASTWQVLRVDGRWIADLRA